MWKERAVQSRRKKGGGRDGRDKKGLDERRRQGVGKVKEGLRNKEGR
jgi:hypothetical protein